MQNSFFNFLGSALIPELSADIAAGTAGNVHLALIGVAAGGALPDQLAALVLFDHDLTVVAAALAVVALGVELCIHDMIVDKLHNGNDRIQIVLHIRHFHIADSAAGGQRLEFGFQCQLVKGVDGLGNVNVIAVGDIVFIGHARYDAESLLQTFGKLVGGAFQRRAVERIIDVLLGLPFGGVFVEFLHDFNRLSCTENSIAGVSKTWKDIVPVIESFIKGSKVDVNIRMCLIHCLYALR